MFIQLLRRRVLEPPRNNCSGRRGPVKGETSPEACGGPACQGGVSGPRNSDVSSWAGPRAPGTNHLITERGRGHPGPITERGGGHPGGVGLPPEPPSVSSQVPECRVRAAGPGRRRCVSGVDGSARPCASRRLCGRGWRWPGSPGQSSTWGRQEAPRVRQRAAGTSLWGVWWQDGLSEVPLGIGVGAPGSLREWVPGCRGAGVPPRTGPGIPPRMGPEAPGVEVPPRRGARVQGCWSPSTNESQAAGCWGPSVNGSQGAGVFPRTGPGIPPRTGRGATG